MNISYTELARSAWTPIQMLKNSVSIEPFFQNVYEKNPDLEVPTTKLVVLEEDDRKLFLDHRYTSYHYSSFHWYSLSQANIKCPLHTW